jgi:hypothetical protein
LPSLLTLRQLQADVNGQASCQTWLKDSGGKSRGGSDTSPVSTFEIVARMVNDAPSFALTSPSLSLAAYAPGITTATRTSSVIDQISAGPREEGGTQTVQFGVEVHPDEAYLFSNLPSIQMEGSQATMSLTLTPYKTTMNFVSLKITAFDNGGTAYGGINSSVQTLLLAVNFVNTPPTFTIASSTLQVREGSAYAGDFIRNISNGMFARDEAKQQVSFSVTKFTSDVESLFLVLPRLDARGALTFELLPHAFGHATFLVSAKDSGGGRDTSDVQNFTIEVGFVNNPPVFEVKAKAGPFFMNADISVPDFVFSISQGDERENDQNITFTVNFKSGELLVSSIGISPDGILSLDLAHNTYGIARYEVVAVDSGIGNNTSVAKSFDLEILFKNQAPSFSLNLTILVVDEDSNCDCECGHVGLCCTSGRCSMPQFVRNISRGPDLFLEAVQELSFVITPAAGAEGLIKPGAAVDENGTLMFELVKHQNGLATFSIYLQDSGGTDGGGIDRNPTATFKIQVNSFNNPPSFDMVTNKVVVKQHSKFTMINLVSRVSKGPANEVGQSISFVIHQVSGPVLFELHPSVAFSDGMLALHIGDLYGTAQYTIFAVDSDGIANSSSNVSTFTIEVLQVNLPPAFDVLAPSHIRAAAADQVACASCRASDLCADCVQYQEGIVLEKTFSLVSGGIRFEDAFAVNISTGHPSESLQNLTFALTTLGGSDALFVGGKAPIVEASSGMLRFVVAAGVSGRAEYSIALHDDGGVTNGGQNASSQTVRLVISVASRVIQFSFSVTSIVNDLATVQSVQKAVALTLNLEPWMIEVQIQQNPNRRLLSLATIIIIIRASNQTQVESTQVLLQTTYSSNPIPSLNLSVVGGVNNIQVGSLGTQVQNASFDMLRRIEVTSGSPPPVVRSENFVSNMVFAQDPSDNGVLGAEMTFSVTGFMNVDLFSEFPSISSDGMLRFTPAAGKAGYSNVTVVVDYNGPLADRVREFQIIVNPRAIEPDFQFPWVATCVGFGQQESCRCSGTDDITGGESCARADRESAVIVPQNSGWNEVHFFAAGISTSRHHMPWRSTSIRISNESILETVVEGQDTKMIHAHSLYASQVTRVRTGKGNIFEISADFVTDSLSVFKVLNDRLEFVQRRREGEVQVTLSPYQDLENTAVCGLESFTIGTNKFVFVSSGCDLPRNNIDMLPKKDKYKLNRTWDDCKSQFTSKACYSLGNEPETTLWTRDTVGYWDFSSSHFYGKSMRVSSDTRCLEQVKGLNVSPAYVRDLRSRLGSAVLRGPACKARSDWDTTSNSTLNLLSFVINSGKYEAVMFDSRQNSRGVIVADDIQPLLDQGTLPRNDLSIEIWCTLDAEETHFAGVIAAAQSASDFFSGWSLGYASSRGQRTLYWSIATQGQSKRHTAAYECPVAVCGAGTWVHVIAVYDGANVSLWLNGDRVSMTAACDAHFCGDIAYALVGQDGVQASTPLVIGAYHNSRVGLTYPHVGAIKSVQIYRSVLSAATIRSRFNIHADLLEIPVQIEEYWAGTHPDTHGLASPTTLLASAALSTNMSVYGKFSPSKEYRCQYATMDAVVLSKAVTAASDHEIRCDTPDTPAFPFGFKATRFSLLERVLPSDVFTPVKWKPVWQRICTDERCGYVPVHDRGSKTPTWDIVLGLHKLHGAPTTFTFIAQSRLYKMNLDTESLEVVGKVSSVVGIASATHFSDNGRNYLLTANYWDGGSTAVDSILYEVDPTAFSLTEVQRIPSQAAYQWAACPMIDTARMFVLASFSGHTSVFTWNSGTRRLVHKDVIPTQSATSAQCFEWHGKIYLGVTQFFDANTFSHQTDFLLLRLNGTKFEPFQLLPTYGARDFKSFQLDSSMFVTIVHEMAEYTSVFKWNNVSSLFLEHQLIPTVKATSCDLFNVNGVALLAVAQLSDCNIVQTGVSSDTGCSYLYRWNGTLFEGIPRANALLSNTAGGQALPARAEVQQLLHMDIGLPTLSPNNPRTVLAVGAFESQIEVEVSCLTAEYVETLCTKKTRNVFLEIWVSQWTQIAGVLRGPSALAVNPDGRHIYVAARESRAISVFSIHADSGHVTYEPALTTHQNLDFEINSLAFFETVSASGVRGSCGYATSSYPGSLRVYRVTDTGSLDLMQTFQQNPTSGVMIERIMNGLVGAGSVAVGRNGTALVVTGYVADSLSYFDRTPEDGLLTYRERIKNGERSWTNLPRPSKSLFNHTDSATSGCHFKIESSHFVAVASPFEICSVFVWSQSARNFVFFQHLSASMNVRYVTHHKFAHDDFLFTASPALSESDNLTSAYRWNSTTKKFEFLDFLFEVDTGGKIKYPTRIHPFQISSDLYIAVAYMMTDGSYETSSTVFRWLPLSRIFVVHQNLPSRWATDVEFIKAGNDHILVISDFLKTEINMTVESLVGSNQYTHSSEFCQQGETNHTYTIWRPNDITNYKRVGDTVSVCHGSGPCAMPRSLLIKDGPWLARPNSYVVSAALEDGMYAFWRPVSQTGYYCMGQVFGPIASQPDTDLIRCIKQDLLVPHELSKAIWPDFVTPSPNCTSQIALFDVPNFNSFVALSTANSDNKIGVQPRDWTVPKHLNAWQILDYHVPSSVQMSLSRTSAKVYVFNASSQRFVHRHNIDTVGAYDLETFHMSTKLPLGASAVRTFLAIANRQAQAPQVFGDQSLFDNDPVIYEWKAGFQFELFQTLSNISSIAEDFCQLKGAQCECVDDSDSLPMLFDTCTSYARGQLNHGFCHVDGVCDVCKVSCSEECGTGCSDPDLHFRNVRRVENSWSTVSSIRGATGIRHFQVDGEQFLVIAQSTCEPLGSRDACLDTGLTQPQSAVLQWNGVRFGPLLALPPKSTPSPLDLEISNVHKFSLRIPAGAVLEWEFIEVPVGNITSRFLMGFSLTAGIVTLEWEHSKISGLSGIVDATFGAFDAQIFTISNGLDNALASFSCIPVQDSLDNLVSNLQFQNSWTEGTGGVHGLKSGGTIEANSSLMVKAEHSPQDLIVKSIPANHELVCGDPPLYLHDIAGQQTKSFLYDWQSKYASGCHEMVFNVTFHSGSPELMAAVPNVYSNGTVNFLVVDGKVGEATYKASLYKRENPNARHSQLFTIKVAAVNKAPGFVIANISVDEDSGMHNLSFATQLSAGAPNEDGQNLNWRYSFTNPGLFATPPVLHVHGDSGVVEFSLAADAYGTSVVYVELEDDGGLGQTQKVTGTTSSAILLGGKMSTRGKFFIHVRGLNDPPTFDLTDRSIFFVDSGLQTMPGFARGMAPGPWNEASQTMSFVLSYVYNAGAAYPGGCIVISNIQNCHDGNVCCTPRYFSQEPRLSADGTLSFNPAPFVSGSLNLYFTLVDNGGKGNGDVYNLTKSSVLIILPANHAPTFNLPMPNITIAVDRLQSKSIALPGFAMDITTGAPDEEAMQKISFQVTVLSNSHVFRTPPFLSADGTLEFETNPDVLGTATGNIRLIDDGGTINVGQDTSATVNFQIQVGYVNKPPTFRLSSTHVHAVEDQAYTEIPAFVTDINPGADDEDWQDLTFDISVLSSPDDLFQIYPSIDKDGTLRLVPSQNKYGTATVNVRLSDDGGVVSGGQDQNIGGVNAFSVYVHPQPRISHVTPRFGRARGGDRVTIHGSYFETPLGKADMDMPCSKASAYLGDVECAQSITISADELICISSPGLGLNAVRVQVSNGATAREGRLIDAFVQIGVFFAGTSRDGSGGYLGFGPGYGGVGSVQRPSASVDFLPSMDPITDKGVRAVANFKGATYFAGQFLRAGLVSVYHIASYDGLELKALGGGADGVINTLTILGDLLIVGGGFTRVFPPLSTQGDTDSSGIIYSGGLAAWNGATWTMVGNTRLEGIVSASIVNGSQLFIGGRFHDPEKQNNLARFNGTHWSSFCDVFDSMACGVTGGEVAAMTVDGADLYVGGSFTRAGVVDAHRIARYDGYHWYSLGHFNGNVNALSVANGNLFAGGEFTQHNGVQRNYVARFRSGQWYDLGEGVGGAVWTLAAMSNCIFVGGSFNKVGGQSTVAEVPYLNAGRWCFDPAKDVSAWEPVDWATKEAGTCFAIVEA